MRRITLSRFGDATDHDAARVLDQAGNVLAVIAAPAVPPDQETLRDTIVDIVLDQDFGDVILAGVAFAPEWGGDAIGFT